jgi:hypothetical protein
MLTVADFVAQLPASEQTALANAVGVGLLNARLSAQCFTDRGPQTENVAQLLAYLSRAILEFEIARAVVVRHSVSANEGATRG